MSFGPNKQTSAAATNNANIANTATQNSAAQTGMGTSLIGQGQGTLNTGTNYFNTLLNGNRANTTAMLQPNIQQIRDTNNENLHAISTLSPRGGGRSGTLFGAAYAPSQQINSLYNGARGGAAGNLAQIGLQQQGLGTNILNSGNSALNTGAQTNTGLLNYGLGQQQLSNQMWSGLGQGLFGLATTPFGGGAGGIGANLLQRI